MNHDSDLLGVSGLLTAAELQTRETVREFVDARVKPNIASWYEDGVFPLDLVGELGALGLLGMSLHGYGCGGRTAVEYGAAVMELEAGDSGIRTFVSVQGSLSMTAIHRHGSHEQKLNWLPSMASGQTIGCFGLTEAGAGSDPASMTTFARRAGSGPDADWLITGGKRWIGLASVADIAIVWAMTDSGVRGFIVPTDTPGFTATPIARKLSMRASIQCDIVLDSVRVPASALLPGAKGLRGALECLNEARYGIMWGVMGAARDAYETALSYAQERQVFGKPLASFQLTQEKLVNMALELGKGQLLAIHLGRLKDAGTLAPAQISAGKLNNTREAIKICSQARTILGGNGITGDYSPLRHINNFESVRTYEGTDEIHTLILGQHITGISAFG